MEDAYIKDTIEYFERHNINIDKKEYEKSGDIIGKLGANSYFKIEKVLGDKEVFTLKLWGNLESTKNFVSLLTKIDFRVS